MRSRFRPSHGTVVAYLALFVALGGTTYAATGGNFILGKPNTANSQTSLTASPSFAGKALQLTNTNTGAGATALGLSVASGHAPFTVNTGTKVANLNADKLDGIDSSGSLGVNAKAADADQLDGKDSTDFLSSNVVLHTTDVSIAPGFGTSSTVNCGGGEVALGGGVGFVSNGNPTFHAGSPVVMSRPKDDLSGWMAAMTNNLTASMTMRIFVICTS